MCFFSQASRTSKEMRKEQKFSCLSLGTFYCYDLCGCYLGRRVLLAVDNGNDDLARPKVQTKELPVLPLIEFHTLVHALQTHRSPFIERTT